MAEQQLNLLKLTARGSAQLRGRATQIMRRDVRQTSPDDIRFNVCQTTFSVSRSPKTRSPRLTGRNRCPSVTLATAGHASIVFFTHAGIGIVRTCPFFPIRSTMHQRLFLCWVCFIVRFASSDRRSPHPSRVANIARSRSPFFVRTSGAFSSVCA